MLQQLLALKPTDAAPAPAPHRRQLMAMLDRGVLKLLKTHAQVRARGFTGFTRTIPRGVLKLFKTYAQVHVRGIIM